MEVLPAPGFVCEQRDLLAWVARVGWSGAWPAVGLPDDYARIARDRCAVQLRGLLS
jgi:hypothetical protein